MEGSIKSTTYETMENSIFDALDYATRSADEEMVAEIYGYALGRGLSNEELDPLYEKIIRLHERTEDLGYL